MFLDMSVIETPKAPVLFIPHGGGPLPLLGDVSHQIMNSFLKEISNHIQKPKKVVVISAHWEEEDVQIIGAQDHIPLLYDYYGFPKEAYQISYPVQGNKKLVAELVQLFEQHNIFVQHNKERGFDHGVFVPLKIMYPQADIDVVQISLCKNLDPTHHLKIGNILQKIRSNPEILILGSGFSFHNMQAFFQRGNQQMDVYNNAFQLWLTQVITDTDISYRKQSLIQWLQKAPFARFCHPREEHLMPLFVCAGASQEQGEIVFDDEIFGKRSLGFLWRN